MDQTVQQKRAKYALDKVNRLSKLFPKDPEKQKKFEKEFNSYASGLPAMIHMNGLGQAMAFCKAKGKDKENDNNKDKHEPYQELYQIVSEWLCKEKQPYHDCNDMLAGITQKNRHSYQLAQVEALALMSWVKKFAKAFLAYEDQA
jgi:CRISPR-associated protein Cmr5